MSFLFLDIETTGLNIVTDDILEIGVIATDNNLETIEEARWYIDQPSNVWEKCTPFVYAMHQGSGLFAEWSEAKGLGETHNLNIVAAELGIISLTSSTITGNSVATLAGMGVSHFDYRWIKRYMPAFAETIGYATADVSCARRLVPDLNLPKADEHRAIADARRALDVARVFRHCLTSGAHVPQRNA